MMSAKAMPASRQGPNYRKVVVVGAGDVGASFAFALAQDGVASEIALLDARPGQAEGQALDMAHGLPFLTPTNIHAGDQHDYADADVIVITAGAKQRPDESRLNLLERNATIIRSIMDGIIAQKAPGIVVIVSNPVDILTYVAQQHSGWPRERIIGSGTVLDSARFRYLLSRHCGVDVRNMHAYILGEHGDSEIAAWSMTHVAGMPMTDYCAICGECDDWAKTREEIVVQVRRSAYHIIDYKGSTCYGIGLALVRIVGAILRDEHSVLTVSCRLDGEYGIRDVCLSVPCVVSRQGIQRIIQGRLTEAEQQGLSRSAAILRGTLDDLARTTTGGTQ
jgi:L-lactate dehydrogenase